MLLLSYFSDRFATRGIPVASVFVLQIIGWAILLAVPAAHVTHSELHSRYFGCICVVTSCYCNIPLLLCELTPGSALIVGWQADNSAIESQRAAALGLMTTIGQVLALVSAFM